MEIRKPLICKSSTPSLYSRFRVTNDLLIPFGLKPAQTELHNLFDLHAQVSMFVTMKALLSATACNNTTQALYESTTLWLIV